MAVFMTAKCLLSIVTLWASSIKITQQSIAGVTYMDNFDFEERYRNLHECDPLYWHPLHLPSKCAKMYEKVIRSRLANHRSVRIATQKDDAYDLNRYSAFISQLLLENNSDIEYDDEVKGELGTSYVKDVENFSIDDFSRIYRSRAPFEIMLDALREDVMNDPSPPQIEMMPNLGMVAVYRQPISRKSEDIIKSVALGYGKAGAASYVQAGLFAEATTKANVYSVTGVYHGSDEDGPSQTHYKMKVFPGIKSKPSNENLHLNAVEQPKPKKKNTKNNRVKKKKIVKGNMVYYMENKMMS